MPILYNVDCHEALKRMRKNSVDLILTDPPYGITPCYWDKELRWQELRKDLFRVLKNNKVMALFGSDPFAFKIKNEFSDLFKYSWIWNKVQRGGTFVHAKNMPIKITDEVMIFSYGKIAHKGMSKKRMPYYPQGLKVINAIRRDGRYTKNPDSFNGQTGMMKSKIKDCKTHFQKFTNYPKNLLNQFFSNPTSCVFHATQKPTDLLEYLIKTYTRKNATVLDFCMGSGSTGVAAKKTGRKFIGIELDKRYYDIAIDRIISAKSEN